MASWKYQPVIPSISFKNEVLQTQLPENKLIQNLATINHKKHKPGDKKNLVTKLLTGIPFKIIYFFTIQKPFAPIRLSILPWQFKFFHSS
jgi:hypothetical protein